MQTFVRSALGALFAFSLVGCGGAQTPSAESPEPTAKTEKTEQEPKKAATAEPKSADEPEEADPRADGLRKASRPPGELITGPNLIYMFNFKESEVGRAAQERCSEQAGDSPREMAACMEKARSKVPFESVRFVKAGSGQNFFIVYNRYKGNLLKWNKVQYLNGEETADRITLNLVGKDEGIAPMAKVPRSISIDLPNDYSIVLNHPDHGAMYFDAKIGTLEEG